MIFSIICTGAYRLSLRSVFLILDKFTNMPPVILLKTVLNHGLYPLHQFHTSFVMYTSNKLAYIYSYGQTCSYLVYNFGSYASYI